ncbi:MAG: glycosyltransferase [Candidatus Hydrogenedentota bacterium]
MTGSATPRVSVVMPFHDSSAKLTFALDSLCRQTWTAFEVIAVDDGSTDDGPAIVRRYVAHDERVRLFEAGRVGIVAALRMGCAAARGEFIARMDADDVAYPGRLAHQHALLERHRQVALCGTQVRMTGPAVGMGRRRYAHWINGLTAPEAIAREIYIECPVPHPTFFMRRAAYEAVGGYLDHGWPEDYDLLFRLHAAGYGIAKVSKVLLDWHDTPGRLSRCDARYSEAAFRAVKRHYLLEGPLRGAPRFFQWGAGEVGKRWLREWGTCPPEAVVDINPRKIGRTIHGTPVVAPEALPGPGAAVTLVAVGAPGAREEIRDWFAARGYAEAADYWFVA